MKHNQKGFSVVEVLLMLIFVAIVAFIGVYVVLNRNPKNTASTTTTSARENSIFSMTKFNCMIRFAC